MSYKSKSKFSGLKFNGEESPEMRKALQPLIAWADKIALQLNQEFKALERTVALSPSETVIRNIIGAPVRAFLGGGVPTKEAEEEAEEAAAGGLSPQVRSGSDTASAGGTIIIFSTAMPNNNYTLWAWALSGTFMVEVATSTQSAVGFTADPGETVTVRYIAIENL